MLRRLITFLAAAGLAVGAILPATGLVARADIDQSDASTNNAPVDVFNAPFNEGSDIGVLVTGDDANIFGNQTNDHSIGSNNEDVADVDASINIDDRDIVTDNCTTGLSASASTVNCANAT